MGERAASRVADPRLSSAVRFAFGSTLAEKQTVQNWIADSAAEMQAARLMTIHAAERVDQQLAARP